MMALKNRVVWTQGMLLRTQVFQQQDRYVEDLVRSAVHGLVSHAFGFRQVELDYALLRQGKIAVKSCDGILPDGTPFSIPEQAERPTPLDYADLARKGVTADGIVRLALPVQQEDEIEFDSSSNPSLSARYVIGEIDVRDNVTGSVSQAQVKVARPHFRLLFPTAERGRYTCMGICRVMTVSPDREIVLDNSYIPSCLAVKASPVLTEYLNEILGPLERVARSRAEYVTGRAAGGVYDYTDLLVLQLVNRFTPVISQMAQEPHVHPERLFDLFLAFAGEASTFVGENRRPGTFVPYQHEDLASCFGPLRIELQRILAELGRPERPSVPVPLRIHRSGVRTAEVQDRTLYTNATFVLAVHASLRAEEIRDRFPRQVTIGSADELAQLISDRVRGVPLVHLSTVPREIPLRRGMLYFEMDRHNEYWRRLPGSTGLALKVLEEFPDLVLECWATRD
jgi:type VI secretion system protein ImpJ